MATKSDRIPRWLSHEGNFILWLDKWPCIYLGRLLLKIQNGAQDGRRSRTKIYVFYKNRKKNFQYGKRKIIDHWRLNAISNIYAWNDINDRL